ncbi:DUF4868 domain-containing protein [Methanosphaerula palustris]|uniref:DUF4868 domain-containing protein n=1 Tax=Methanosphaerula palustris (strain ATCC BAA-1556 / DSM 19958 / E1-9c) TaxID=521011 RepID=B8GFF4_METPE|nr:DUF4868 domain-containing protein [Methanosphaerula palustris]ACL16002.1 hypothetical protein Mpal_0631 [Methanosphaerula palustris E1-9c]
MDEILQCIKNADNNYIKLFFITRKKSQKNKEIKYNVLKAKINSDISEDLKNSGSNQIGSILKKDPEYIDYGILSDFDRVTIEKISTDEVPYLYDILRSMANPNLDLVTDEDLEQVWGYVVRIECFTKTLFLFKKYTPNKLLVKGKKLLRMQDGQFTNLNTQIITIDSSYDAVLLIESSTEISQKIPSSDVFVLSRASFESFFSFVEIYKSEVEANKKYLIEKSLLNNVTLLIENCINDGRKIRKLARIIKNDQLQSITIEKIKKMVQDYNLDIYFDATGKIEFTPEKIWVFLRIFDDDYVKSEITDIKYEVRSKVKK